MEISNEVTEEEYNEALKNKELLRKKLFDLRYEQYEHKKDTQKSIEINELINDKPYSLNLFVADNKSLFTPSVSVFPPVITLFLIRLSFVCSLILIEGIYNATPSNIELLPLVIIEIAKLSSKYLLNFNLRNSGT